MEDFEIIKTLENYYNFLITKYGSNRILGVFLYGSQNYNFSTDNSDIDAKAIYIPTFNEIAAGGTLLSKELHMYNGAHVEIKDIREMCKMWKKQNINFLEILFTDYNIINPEYLAIFNKYFITNRDSIANYNMAEGITSIGYQALNLIKGNNLTGKQMANFYRLAFFLNNYAAGKNYKECLLVPQKHRAALLNLKKQPTCDTLKSYVFLPDLEKTKTMIRDLICSNKEFLNVTNPKVDTILLEGTKEVLKKNWNI